MLLIWTLTLCVLSSYLTGHVEPFPMLEDSLHSKYGDLHWMLALAMIVLAVSIKLIGTIPPISDRKPVFHTLWSYVPEYETQKIISGIAHSRFAWFGF